MTSIRSTLGVLALSLLGIVSACVGEDPGASGPSVTGGGGGGEGGADGGEGGSMTGGSAKPTCPDPSAPMGATPDPRADSAGALRADGTAFLLFGGDTAIVICGQTPKREHVGDTWLLDTACGGWTKLELAGPSPRARHSIALDPVSGKAFLFGGRYRAGDSGSYTNYNDVWSFDFSAKVWTEVIAAGAPPSKRSNTATAVVGGKLVVFGGNSSTSGLSFTPQDDVFVLDLATNAWTEITPANAGPQGRLFHAMAAHPTKNVVYVFSGGDENAFVGPFFTDTWALDLDTATWSKLSDATPDGTGRIKLGLWATVPDGATEPTLFAFGGHDDGQLGNRNDVLAATVGPTLTFEPVRAGDTYNNPASGQCDFPVDFTLLDEESPERRSAFAIGQLPDGSAAVIFGGDSDCGRLSDAHWFDTRAGAWTPIRATLPGLVCERTGSTTCTSLCN